MPTLRFFRAAEYIRHRWQALDAHSLHSPFLYRIYIEVILAASTSHSRPEVTGMYQKLYDDHSNVEITDFGTGNNRTCTVSQTARSNHHRKTGRLLYHLTRYFKPSQILELGANLGLGTINLALGAPEAKILTLEGCPNLSRSATQNFQELGLHNVRLQNVRIESALPSILQGLPQLDLIYFDANHRFDPTIENFELCLPSCHEKSIMVFDDIYWSPEMKLAWKEIRKHHLVSTSLDLYQVGMVFFNQALPQGNFIIKF